MRITAKSILAALVLLGSSLAAHADTIEQGFTPFIYLTYPSGSASMDLGSISPFNPSLGTLDSVTLFVSIGGSGSGGGGIFTVTDTADSDAYSVSTGLYASIFTGSSSAELTDFENGPLDGSLSYNRGNGIIVNPDGGGYVAEVIYTYTPAATPAATPEPSSLSMLGTGMLAGAGMLVRRRRAVRS